jgi:hypothetical protein
VNAIDFESGEKTGSPYESVAVAVACPFEDWRRAGALPSDFGRSLTPVNL